VNATQNHRDSAFLMKRVPGDIIEPRQVLSAFPVVAIIVLTISWIESDDPVRGNDVDFLEEHLD
jgi:hypothetical protein